MMWGIARSRVSREFLGRSEALTKFNCHNCEILLLPELSPRKIVLFSQKRTDSRRSRSIIEYRLGRRSGHVCEDALAVAGFSIPTIPRQTFLTYKRLFLFFFLSSRDAHETEMTSEEQTCTPCSLPDTQNAEGMLTQSQEVASQQQTLMIWGKLYSLRVPLKDLGRRSLHKRDARPLILYTLLLRMYQLFQKWRKIRRIVSGDPKVVTFP